MKINIIILILVLFANIAFAEVKPITPAIESNDCQKLEKEIKDLFKECQACKTDQDCYLETEWYRGCPFGCNNILSLSKIQDSDNEDAIKRKLKNYREKCEICIYKCGTAPKENEIGCRNNKCVDLRYYKDE